ncbi:MAG: cobyrinate a,c-diamide synthase [Nocardioidaceae bacterium]
MSLPRVVVAAPASGHGKTTVATGLMAALRRAGHEVSGHKVGPDYIDPGYHALATGRPGRNLDPHLVGADLLVPLLLHGSRSPAPADVAVVEGVMGLYDGALGRDGFASTAHVAGVLQAPVVLVVDISHASRSVAAVVHGMASFDPAVTVAGVVLNKAGSERHATEVRRAVEALGIEVLGVLHRDDGIVAPSRHLGLVPAAERRDAAAALDRLARQVARDVDLERVLAIARSAPGLDAAPWDAAEALVAEAPSLVEEVAQRPCRDQAPVVAVAGGRAFTFRYPETEELLVAAGLRPVAFDPMTDTALPAGTAGIYLGGGFPEVHAAELSANEPMRRALAAAIGAGVPTVAECAGLLYLCSAVDGSPMVGALAATGAMTSRLTLGYRTATARHDNLLARAGDIVTGHEFHRTTVSGLDELDQRAWDLGASHDGVAGSTLHASYLHVHWAGHPQLAARFASAVHGLDRLDHRGTRGRRSGEMPPAVDGPGLRERSERVVGRGRLSAQPPGPDQPPGGFETLASLAPQPAGIDLDHHGDRDLAPGLVDLAVNVHLGPRPSWLDDALRASLDDLAAYPDAGEARRALAARHGRAEEEVLPTAGGAEAFTLLARARGWRRPVVVHPQFTEPEAALRAAGQDVTRVLLRPEDGFALDPRLVPEDADLVVLGNPTNPTGVLHPAATLALLARPGRVVAVDEAFMDAVPAEPESLAGKAIPGVVVLRSLTKTWSMPGVRAGYAVGDAQVLRDLAAQQPPWSVSAMAVRAMLACSTPEAVREADRRARAVDAPRRLLVDGLTTAGLTVVSAPATPFVLVRGPLGLREALRDKGFAVRRGDTFPGLGPAWVRIAVRDEATTTGLLAAVLEVVEPARA